MTENNFIKAAESKILDSAKKYQLMNTFGIYIKDENVIHVSLGDKEMYVQQFLLELLDSSKDYLIELVVSK